MACKPGAGSCYNPIRRRVYSRIGTAGRAGGANRANQEPHGAPGPKALPGGRSQSELHVRRRDPLPHTDRRPRTRARPRFQPRAAARERDRLRELRGAERPDRPRARPRLPGHPLPRPQHLHQVASPTSPRRRGACRKRPTKQVMRIRCSSATTSPKRGGEGVRANTISPFLFSRAFLGFHGRATACSPPSRRIFLGPGAMPMEQSHPRPAPAEAGGTSGPTSAQDARVVGCVMWTMPTDPRPGDRERPRGLGLHRETPGDDAQQPEHDLAPGGEPPQGQHLEPARPLSPWPPGPPRSCSGPRARAS